MKWEYDFEVLRKNTVTTYFNGVPVLVPVSDANIVAEAVMYTYIKAKGVMTGQIKTLWFESAIFDLDDNDDAVPVIAHSITAPINTVRTMLNEEARASAPSSGDLSCQLLAATLPAMSKVDPSSQIELALARALN